MNKEIHLFYIGSYLHLIVADGIITMKQLPLEDVFFVTYRGVKLPSCYADNLLYDESKTRSSRFVIKNFFWLKRLLKGKKVCGYFPFQGQFPVMKYYDRYIFFEEGLSAYESSMEYSRCNKEVFFKVLLKKILLYPFLGRKINGILNGRLNGSPFPIECTLVGLSDQSYKNVVIDNCGHETIQVSRRPLNKSSIHDSVIIVMDSTHATDRMESVDNYLTILSDVIKGIDINSRKVYLKLHPDNFKDMDAALELIKKYLGFLNFNVIDESLEDIALCNQNNLFIGTHSTALFYAPIFGDTNRAISFSRIYANRDAVYAKWLLPWGGIEGFLSLFKQHIECL